MRSIAYFLLLCFCLSAPVSMHAQPTLHRVTMSELLAPESWAYGLTAEGTFNLHTANFQHLPDVPNCCPLFESGRGIGSVFGLWGEHFLGGATAIGARLQYNNYNGTLKADEALTISVNSVATPAVDEHSIASQFSDLAFEPYFRYNLTSQLSIAGGPSIGLTTVKSYQQSEALIQPVDQGTFTNAQRTRNNFSGTLTDAQSIRAGLLASISYDIPLNVANTFRASPEIAIDYPLTPLVKGLEWRVTTFRAGIRLGFYMPESQGIPPPPPIVPVKPDTTLVAVVAPISPKPPVLTASMSVAGIESDGRTTSQLDIHVEEFYSTELVPLLPFVCFDKASAVIPLRLHAIGAAEAASFQLRKTDTTNSLAIYYDLLNIVGSRLREHPKSRIILIGCTSNEPDETKEHGLAKKRADAVAQYIENTWAIPARRISIVARGLPEHPSSSSTADGNEENRRVEIQSNDPSVLDPVVLSDTIRTATPPMLRFSPDVHAERGVARWQLDVSQQQKQLHEDLDTGQVHSLIWDLSKDPLHIPSTASPLDYAFVVTDSAHQMTQSGGSIPVTQTTLRQKRLERKADKTIERYTLILFNFGSGELDAANKRRISLIKDQITDSTEVYVTGHTDRTGEDLSNIHLSELRAQAAANALNAKGATVSGMGKSTLLYDNNTPEGRFYSRTVDVVLIKPLKQGTK
ncbi:MAG: OmpA family protein [Candidatus Kapaibacterium sp.]|jgi:outer membrane protein OmpA-like peptidoglycan-associated protein